MNKLIKRLTPTDLRITIKSLQSLLHSKMPINVRGIKGRIRKLQATLIASTKCRSSKSAAQGNAKTITLPSPPPIGSPSERQDYQNGAPTPPLLSTKTRFGEKVAECRAKATPSLSQQGLSKKLIENGLNISPSQVAEIENGTLILNCYQASVLASVLNSTVPELYT
jgi:hypothetical protein